MAQSGFTPIQLYYSSTTTNAPTAGNLASGELAINITDGKLFYKDNANAVQVIAWKVTPTSAGGTGLTSYTAGDMVYYASGTTLTNLAIGASGRYMSSTGSAPQWSAPAALTKTDDTNVTLTLGGSPSTALLNAASLTLGWTGQLSVGRGGTGLSSVTSGYIPYGNGSSALSTSANLQYNGTTLMVGTSSSAPGTGAIQITPKNSVGLGTNDTLGYYTGAFYVSSILRGYIYTDVSGTTYSTSSDARLKNDKGVCVDGSVIDQTIVHDYEWKENGQIDRGVFAQEAYEIKPSAIKVGLDDENGNIKFPWGVDYSRYVPDLIVHAQQLKKSLDELRADFEAYKAAHP